MSTRVHRQTVDLSAYPNLAVIYLGMRAQSLRGIRTLLGFGPKIAKSVAAKPDGLLLHENIIYSLKPLHLGMRQYWRDLESLEQWARALPHQAWWRDFVQNPGGTGFWHELYFKQGGMEAIYSDMKPAPGLALFAPVIPARATMFSARQRLGLESDAASPGPYTEQELYPGVTLPEVLPLAPRDAAPTGTRDE
jgi:hypothetical protein